MWLSPREMPMCTSSLAVDLARAVPDLHRPTLHDLRVDAAQVQLAPDVGVHEAQGVATEAGRELRTAAVRHGRDFEHCGPDGQTGAGRQVRAAQVEVDEEL